LVAGKTGQAAEKFALTLGVHPLIGIEFVVKSTRFGRQPNFVQGLLQVNNDLALVLENESDHGANSLVINVGRRGVIDAVTTALYGPEQRFGLVEKI
jgi:cytochrome bd-type quinol oxidase subunit 1